MFNDSILNNYFNRKKTKQKDTMNTISTRNTMNMNTIHTMNTIYNIPTIHSIPTTIKNYNINTLYNKNITTIHNVYQTNYAQNNKPTGFGDFIRGCYFLLQFCDKYNFKPNIIINHPIALFLKKLSLNFTINKSFIENIPMFFENNWKKSNFDSNNYIINVTHDSQSIHTCLLYTSPSPRD